MAHIEEAVFELLKTLASGKVYYARAPEDVAGSYIVMQRTGSSRWRTINGASGMAQDNFQIDCYGTEQFAVHTLARQVEGILSGYRGTVNVPTIPVVAVRIGGISLLDENDLLEEEKEEFIYRNLAQYLITYEQPTIA